MKFGVEMCFRKTAGSEIGHDWFLPPALFWTVRPPSVTTVIILFVPFGHLSPSHDQVGQSQTVPEMETKPTNTQA